MSLWKVSQIAKENFALGAASRDAEIESMRQRLAAEEEMKHTAMDLCKDYLDELAAALAVIKVKGAFIEKIAKQTQEALAATEPRSTK